MSSVIRPKIEHDQAFMPVLVNSNFDDDSVKYERASMETPFSHYTFLFVCVDVLRPSQQLRSCRADQLPISTVPGKA